MIVNAQAGDLLLQAVAGLRDTVLMKQVDVGIVEHISDVLKALIELALLALILVAIPVVWKFRNVYKKVNALVDRINGDMAPIMKHVTAIADNVNIVTTSIRGDVEKVNATIEAATARVHQAVETAERRLNEFNALLEVVQEEAEHLFVSTASTVRGVRSGASVFSRRDGMEFASVELDAAGALAAEELDTLEDGEEFDGDDSFTEDVEAGPAPRVRPRAHGVRERGRRGRGKT